MFDDEPRTHADHARRHQHQRLICLRLGLDPAQTTSVRVEIDPGQRAVVTWEGREHVALDELQALVAPPPPENEQCPTCTWPSRHTVDMVCHTCGWDFSKGEKP